MATFQVDSDQVQRFQDAIGASFFPLEKLIMASGDASLQALTRAHHAALAAGEGYTVSQSNGSVRPQDGGGNKGGNPP